jgi:hypothetical protein
VPSAFSVDADSVDVELLLEEAEEVEDEVDFAGPVVA